MSNTTNNNPDPPASTATTKPTTTTTTTTTRKKIRPTYSCLNCHKRKVKCDRVKPCGACCLRGTPSECEYGTSKHDRHYIQQSARIENLVRSCESLKRQLAEARRLANLPPVKDEEEEISQRPYDEEDDDHPDNPSIVSSSSSSSSSSAVGPQAHSLRDHESRTRKPSTWDLGRNSVAHASKSSSASFPRSPSHDKALLTDPALANALIEFFVERLISNFSPRNVNGTIALREASTRRVFSPLLCKAFEAASLTFAGCRDHNRQIEHAGHARYIRVLGMLQNSLYDQNGRHSTEVLVVVLLSTIIEAFKQSSKDSILKHQLGGLELLRSRSPYRHRYGIERSLFVDLRLYWVTAALVHRKPTFLASKEWLTVPWPGDAPSKDILHRLLDVAVHIPGYLSQVDEFSAKLRYYNGGTNDAASSTAELSLLQSAIWEQAKEIQAQMQMWKTIYADPYCPGAPWEEKPDFAFPEPPCPSSDANDKVQKKDNCNDDNFPVFRCRNPRTMQLIIAKPFVFPDLLLATSLCFYWALGLLVSSSDTGLVSVLDQQERYQYACNICRSMKYYIRNIPGCLVSRIMFVLRTAFDAFSDGMIEKEFLGELFLYIGRKFEFPVFSNKCTDSASVRKP